MLPSPLTSVGSKYYAIAYNNINQYIPISTDNHFTYVELFSGSAVMFFNVQTRSAILNDLDHRIFNFFDVISNNTLYNEFVHELEFVHVGKDWFEKYKDRIDPISQAIAFYIQNRNVFGGVNNPIGDDSWCWRTKPKLFVKDFTKWKAKMDQCYLVVWNLDFREALRKINEQSEGGRERYVIFEDPPYMKDSLGSLYFKDFMWEDHVDLARLNHESEHQIIITYDNHDKVRELYSDWYIIEENYRYFVDLKEKTGYGITYF